MAKIYVFGIGGTGARVLRSLTMLLSAGVELDNKNKVDEIVPIFIDPDSGSGDLTRTVELLNKYTTVREKLKFTTSTKNKFFKTKITSINHNFSLPIKDTDDMKFREYIDDSSLDKNNKALVNMLFSEENLNSDMSIGFKGNPNIGSVVLNQLIDTREFEDFANTFEKGDMIFIVSSIFGGTGASGFPLLLKNLRSNKDMKNFALINNAQIGAISVLPYFNLEVNKESAIDSNTFISKTRSALSYYSKNLAELDTLYYIGNNNVPSYQNNDGGYKQENNAHFVELASALSIIDFIKSTDTEREFDKITTSHKEFGIKNDVKDIYFGDLETISKNEIAKPLTKFLLFTKYINEVIYKEYKHQPWAKKVKADKGFFTTNFYSTLKIIQDEYITWLTEMSNNTPSFEPYDISGANKVFDIIKGVEPARVKNIYSEYAYLGYTLIDNELNSEKQLSGTGREDRFMETFHNAMDAIVNKKFNF